MKKLKFITFGILLVLFGTTFFWACSEETTYENQLQTSSHRVGITLEELEELYLEMINSENFIIADEKFYNFIQKMNFDGDISEVNTKEGLFSWIDTNLSTTDFSSLAEAEAEWEEASSYRRASIQQHISFFDALYDEETLKDLTIRFDPIFDDIVVVANGECEEIFNGCMDGINNSYTQDVASANQDFRNGNISAEQRLAKVEQARTNLQIGSGICADHYDDCLITNG